MDRNVTLRIDNTVLHNAFRYAESNGMDLSAIVESFLLRFMAVNENANRQAFPISEKVKSLSTRLKHVPQGFDWEKEKDAYLKEKYEL